MPPRRAVASKAVDLNELLRTYREHIAGLSAAYGRVLGATGWDGVLVHAGTAKMRSAFDDQYWPLRVTPHFQHWLPLAVADCALLVRPGKTPTLYHNVALSFWEGAPKAETDHFWSSFEVVEVADPERVKDLLPQGGRIAFLGEDLERARRWGFDEEALVPRTLLTGLDELRATKSDYEILCLAEANRRAALGHSRVLEAFEDGDHAELDLHLLYLQATRQDDPETPYKNIVALGPHAATLHHVDYGRRAHGAQSLLLDAGACYQGYNSDVTRTAVKGSGEAAALFGELVRRMEALQKEVCRRVEVGVPYETLHNQAHELLAPILRDVGVTTLSEQELVASGVTRKFLPHGLGHSLGLQTHDVGCAVIRPGAENPFLRNTAIVTPGQVFTIEPGCYFVDSLLKELEQGEFRAGLDWKVIDQLRPFGGVRIEDDLVIGERDVRNLTREHLEAGAIIKTS